MKITELLTRAVTAARTASRSAEFASWADAWLAGLDRSAASARRAMRLGEPAMCYDAAWAADLYGRGEPGDDATIASLCRCILNPPARRMQPYLVCIDDEIPIVFPDWVAGLNGRRVRSYQPSEV